MPRRLSDRSVAAIASCHNVLANACLKAFQTLPEGYDIAFIEGHRSREDQKKAYDKGFSKIDGINSLGKHNYFPSRAIDFTPYPGLYQAPQWKFSFLAGFIMSACTVPLRWGGDWDSDFESTDHSFLDLPHLELPGDLIYAEPLRTSIQHSDKIVAYRRQWFGEDWESRFPSQGGFVTPNS